MKNSQIISKGKFYAGAYTTKWPKSKKDIGEDSVLALSNQEGTLSIIAVADGVGGFYGGEIASRNVLRILKEYYWDSGFLHKIKNMKNNNVIAQLDLISSEFVQAVKNRLDSIWEEINSSGIKISKSALQTNLALVIIIDSKVYYTWLGDSRIITFVNGRLFQMSYDHALGVFKSREEINELEKNNDPAKIRVAISTTIEGKGADMFYFFGANMKIVPKLKWFNMSDMFELIYCENKDISSKDFFKKFDFIFIATDGLFFLNLWYLEQLFLALVFSYLSPKTISRILLKFLHEYSTDDMGIAIWCNPQLNREKDLGLLNFPSIFSKLIDECPNPKFLKHWDDLKEKFEKIEDEKVAISLYIEDCKKNPLKKIIYDNKSKEDLFFTIQNIKNIFQYCIIGEFDSRETMIGDWRFDKFSLKSLDTSFKTKFSDIAMKKKDGVYLFKIPILGNYINIEYNVKSNSLEIICDGVSNSIGLFKSTVNQKEIDFNYSNLGTNLVYQCIESIFNKTSIIIEQNLKFLTSVQNNLFSLSENEQIQEYEIFNINRIEEYPTSNRKIGEIYNIQIKEGLPNSERVIMVENLANLHDILSYHMISDYNSQFKKMSHKVDFRIKTNPFILLFGKYNSKFNGYTIFKIIIFLEEI